jgi:leucyl/phenylalanyl-tRNA--protein transferase
MGRRGFEPVTKPRRTFRHPNGLLSFASVRPEPGRDLVAFGGRPEPDTLLDAYRHGVFPWYEADGPVLWWSPDPRAVIRPESLRVSRRLERTIRSGRLEIRVDGDFEGVMRACGEGRREGTWIHEEMVEGYLALSRRGVAHCVEALRGGKVVGGVYGVAVGRVFCAESMFHRERDASKVALARLCRALFAAGFSLVEVQFLTPHLARFGAVEIPREDYLRGLAEGRDDPRPFPSAI